MLNSQVGQINSFLSDLKNNGDDKDKSLDVGINLARLIISFTGNQIEKDSNTIIRQNPLNLPNARRYDSWFQGHPIYQTRRCYFELLDSELLQAKFYWLKKRSKQFVSGSVHFTRNFEDFDYTRNDNYKVGVDFFLSPDGKSLQVVLSNKGSLRIVELYNSLNVTQKEAFESWTNVVNEKDRNKLHQSLWDSFEVESVSKKFYTKISSHFEKVVSHLTNDVGKPKKDSQAFANRLLGRLLFCWFLRKKEIIFEEIGYFNIDPKTNSGEYYKQKLEHLFFKTLNRQPAEREPLPNHLITNPKLFDKDVKDTKTPYLNGGLFDKHDNDWVDESLTFPKNYFKNLFEDLNQFNFTTDESSPTYEQVAIDPEMLGRVFENLLATQRNETGETARKAKGAFYTPRVIVDYMCKDSLRNYLHTKDKKEEYHQAVDKLIDKPDHEWSQYKDDSRKSISNFKETIISALDEVKIIDPACGSGAFPIGMLQLMMQLYERIEVRFDHYKTKLDVIRNNLYGVDIDPMAIEIAKLRAWLSLVVDSRQHNNIEPLPNLDFKLVCADTLVSLDRQQGLASGPFEEEMRAVRFEWFSASKDNEKTAIKERYQSIKEKYSKTLTDKNSEHLNSYQPFVNDSSASFFDHQLMFGIDDFDIVIGNPPYIQLQKNGGELAKKYSGQGYQSLARTGDIYCLFYEVGLRLLKKETGILSYITSNKWLRAAYGEKMRRHFAQNVSVIQLIDLGPGVFNSATVDTNILTIKKSVYNAKPKNACKLESYSEQTSLSNYVKENSVSFEPLKSGDSWVILSAIEKSILDKIKKIGTPLKDWDDINIYRGVLTGYNKAFIVDNETKERLCKEDPKSAEILKPVLRGRDIKRYKAEWAGLWLICTLPSRSVDIEKYPKIKNHLLSFGKEKLEQSGSKLADGSLSRKKTNHKWFEIQDSCAYYEEFEKDKLAWAGISKSFNSHILKPGTYITNSVYFATGNMIRVVQVLLNSKLLSYFMNNLVVVAGSSGRKFLTQHIENIPILVVEKSDEVYNDLNKFGTLMEKCQSSKQKKGLLNDVDKIIYNLYSLSDEEICFIEKINM